MFVTAAGCFPRCDISHESGSLLSNEKCCGHGGHIRGLRLVTDCNSKVTLAELGDAIRQTLPTVFESDGTDPIGVTWTLPNLNIEGGVNFVLRNRKQDTDDQSQTFQRNFQDLGHNGNSRLRPTDRKLIEQSHQNHELYLALFGKWTQDYACRPDR
jgi:hypothetical protein